jgi:hypothetical protein
LGLAAAAVLAGARSIAAIGEWAADAPQPVHAALGARHHAPGHWSVPAEATMRPKSRQNDSHFLTSERWMGSVSLRAPVAAVTLA